jgi:UDP-N-acetylglucosamine--N-acetylmuramyl-(pentapeptide) pyrophosphoryl-undecaprenol N-acetylglucosamine transferase
MFWIGGAKGMERGIVEGAGLEFMGVPAGKLRRSLSPANVADMFRVGAGFFAARRILKRERPALLFSKGGFVSAPPCAAAASLGIPVFSHESDYSPGLATRLNCRFAERVFIPYEESRRFYGRYAAKTTVSGNPVRAPFFSASAEKGRAFLGIPPGEKILLVLGGSQGSQELNGIVAQCRDTLTAAYTIVHQTGQGAAPRGGYRYHPYQYINDAMPDVLAAADLVLCRSGAGTIWEAAALGRPMVLVPLRGSGTRGDQVENARVFSEAGAAVVMEAGFSKDDVCAAVRAVMGDEARRAAMGQAARGIAAVAPGGNTAAYLAKEIIARVRGPGNRGS